MPLHVSSTCAHHQEVKIAVHSLWCHHTYRWPSRARAHVECKNKSDTSNNRGEEKLIIEDETVCPETSVRNYHYSRRYKPEERRSHLLRVGNQKLHLSKSVTPLG